MGRRWAPVVLLLLILVLCACQRAKPERVVSDGLGPMSVSGLQFELLQPPGQKPYQVQGEALALALENCAQDSPLEQVQRRSIAFTPQYKLDQSGTALHLVPYQALIAEIIFRRYALEDAQELEGTVTLRTGGRTRSEFALHWEETWDQNSLQVIRDGQVIDSLPLQVRMSARLVVQGVREEACAGTDTPAAAGTPANAHLPVIGAVQARPEASVTLAPSAAAQSALTPSPTASSRPGVRPSRTPRPTRTVTASPTSIAEATGPRPGSNAAIALVRDYIDYLNQRQWRKAYGLLDEAYQQRMSYDAFAGGYTAVERIDVHAIEATWVDEQHELAQVALTISTASGISDWQASYDLIVRPRKWPHERRIANVRLVRVLPEAEGGLE